MIIIPPKKIRISEYASHLDNIKYIAMLVISDIKINLKQIWRGDWQANKSLRLNMAKISVILII